MAGHLLLIFGSLQKLLLQFLEVLSKSSWTDHPILIWKLVGRSRILKSSDSLVADPPNAQTALLKLSQPERQKQLANQFIWRSGWNQPVHYKGGTWGRSQSSPPAPASASPSRTAPSSWSASSHGGQSDSMQRRSQSPTHWPEQQKMKIKELSLETKIQVFSPPPQSLLDCEQFQFGHRERMKRKEGRKKAILLMILRSQ